MITPLAWNNLAGTLRDQLAHLAQHVEKLEHLPCSGILKTVAAQQQQKAAGIHITPGMQRVLDVIPPHPHGVTRYDLEHRLEWLVADEGQEPQGWAWGWILRSTPEDATEVVNYCDWSQTSEQTRQAKGFPVVEKEKIEATLHRLADELS